VPDAAGASMVMFVDLEKTVASVGTGSTSDSTRKSMEALQAVGFSARSDDGGSGATFALRLTTR
jgi:hypothetical protein